jgi:hypothetical protein
VIYYATTLGIPLVNGAYRQYASFWEHFAFVLVLPLLLVLPALVLRWSAATDTRGKNPRIFSVHPWLN